MPNQAHSGFHHDPWHRCDRCGRDWPTSKLRKGAGLAAGLLLCPEDVDNPIAEERDAVIQDTLRQNVDEGGLADILKAQTVVSNFGEF